MHVKIEDLLVAMLAAIDEEAITILSNTFLLRHLGSYDKHVT